MRYFSTYYKRNRRKKRKKLLKRLQIETVEELVHHYPRCYVTYPEPVSVSEVKTGVRCSILAQIASPVHLKATGKLKLCTCLAADESGQIFLRWFKHALPQKYA